MRRLLTLVFVRRPGELLLGLKKRGFGADKWNGFGGKVEVGETIRSAALRELHEESGLRASSAELLGRLTFTFDPAYESRELEVFVFEAHGVDGELVESEEMLPRWFAEEDIPYDQMWIDDSIWLPTFLNQRYFRARFEFSDFSTLLRHQLKEIDKDEFLASVAEEEEKDITFLETIEESVRDSTPRLHLG